MISTFFDPHIQQQLSEANLGSFEQLWNLPQDWVEPLNQRREGWSGVVRLERPGLTPVFVKRQENHNTRTLQHPLNGVPTYRRELKNIDLFRDNDIPTLSPVFYGERNENGKHQAIFITKALDGYTDLFAVIKRGNKQHTRLALTELARITRDMHDKGLAHYCLYPNHVLVRFDNNKVDVRLIDLEKARRVPLKINIRQKDLTCFLRHARSFSSHDIQLFIDNYFSFGKPDRGTRKFEAQFRETLRKAG